MKRTIKVRFAKEGWHRWASPPPSKEYLRHLHRHLFWIQVELEVLEADREVEFHELLHWSQNQFQMAEGWSCENAAEALLSRLQLRWPQRWAAVECWEDGECGARVELTSKHIIDRVQAVVDELKNWELLSKKPSLKRQT